MFYFSAIMDISRCETSDTFIIADPMRTYTEEADAALNSVYYKHLEANRGNLRAFHREVRQHSASWAWRIASLDSRGIPRNHEDRRSPYGKPCERYAKRLSTERSIHRHPPWRKLVTLAQLGPLQKSQKHPSRPEKEHQPIAQLSREPLMGGIKSSQANLKLQQNKKHQNLLPLKNTLLTQRNEVESEQEKKGPSELTKIEENALSLESNQKASSFLEDYEVIDVPMEQNDDEEQGESSLHAWNGAVLFRSRPRKAKPPQARRQEKQKVTVLEKPFLKDIQIKPKKPKN